MTKEKASASKPTRPSKPPPGAGGQPGREIHRKGGDTAGTAQTQTQTVEATVSAPAEKTEQSEQHLWDRHEGVLYRVQLSEPDYRKREPLRCADQDARDPEAPRCGIVLAVGDLHHEQGPIP
jgi:hypothetical protein